MHVAPRVPLFASTGNHGTTALCAAVPTAHANQLPPEPLSGKEQVRVNEEKERGKEVGEEGVSEKRGEQREKGGKRKY